MAELETKLIHFNEFDEAQTLQFLVIQEQGIDFNIFIEEMQEICIQTQKAIIDLTNTWIWISCKIQLLNPKVDEHSGVTKYPQTRLRFILEVRLYIDIKPQIF